MTLLEKIDNISKLWTLMLPHVPAPSPVWMGRWAASSPDAAIERGIVRASKVFSAERYVEAIPEKVHRYVTGTIRREAEQQTGAAE